MTVPARARRAGVLAAPLAASLAALLAALTATTLAGCAQAPGPVSAQPRFRVIAGATYIPVPPAEAEFTRESTTLTLPASFSWPTHPLRASESGSPEWYQVGYGRQAADWYWFCSWATTAEKATAAEARKDATATLDGIFNLYYYTHALIASSRPLLRQEVTNAQHGDFVALDRDLQQNC